MKKLYLALIVIIICFYLTMNIYLANSADSNVPSAETPAYSFITNPDTGATIIKAGDEEITTVPNGFSVESLGKTSLGGDVFKIINTGESDSNSSDNFKIGNSTITLPVLSEATITKENDSFNVYSKDSATIETKDNNFTDVRNSTFKIDKDGNINYAEYTLGQHPEEIQKFGEDLTIGTGKTGDKIIIGGENNTISTTGSSIIKYNNATFSPISGADILFNESENMISTVNFKNGGTFTSPLSDNISELLQVSSNKNYSLFFDNPKFRGGEGFNYFMNSSNNLGNFVNLADIGSSSTQITMQGNAKVSGFINGEEPFYMRGLAEDSKIVFAPSSEVGDIIIKGNSEVGADNQVIKFNNDNVKVNSRSIKQSLDSSSPVTISAINSKNEYSKIIMGGNQVLLFNNVKIANK